MNALFGERQAPARGRALPSTHKNRRKHDPKQALKK